MDTVFKKIIDTIEPILDQTYGPSYRCALTLTDGTTLPCVTLFSRAARVSLAKRRILEELGKNGSIGGPDPFGEIVANFAASANAASANQVADYGVVSAAKSLYATPVALLEQIEIETTMGWTGWVFEMNDGRQISFGTSFRANFLQIPSGFLFKNIRRVHNHSYVDGGGIMRPLVQGGDLPEGYNTETVFQERVGFECFVDDLEAVESENQGLSIRNLRIATPKGRSENFLLRGLRKLF